MADERDFADRPGEVMDVGPLLDERSTDTRAPKDSVLHPTTRPWWKGAVVYQIYPRSFADSNGDGIGDLMGITARLNHVARLGVDAIWLSLFFTSPMRDFGYDVSDYRGVDPIFGTLADFDALVARAHELGVRVIIDQVYSHTSDQHPWFVESRSSRTNTRADWYVWADPKPDGSPPSNWQSVFGGPAWTWDARRGQYYLHNFLKEQPQLHVHSPEVRAELLETARFWLDRGVDGFRLDALNFMMHEPSMRDNPPAPATNGQRTRPFDFQLKLYNQSHADILPFIERIRGLLDEHGGRFTVAEVGGDDAEREMKAFIEGDGRLNTAYDFDFLYAAALTPAVVADALAKWPESEGWPSWAFENHDAPRAVSRWATPGYEAAFARTKMLLLCLRGNVFLYNGEELGLTQVDVPFDKLQDPEAIANWPLTLSRDGARTPMPWNASDANGGFSRGEPWLPFGPEHLALAADAQEADPGSMLHLTRACVALRRAHPALAVGSFTLVAETTAVLAFKREAAEERMLCVFNLTAQPVDWQPGNPNGWRIVDAVNEARCWHLPPYGALVAEKMA